MTTADTSVVLKKGEGTAATAGGAGRRGEQSMLSRRAFLAASVSSGAFTLLGAGAFAADYDGAGELPGIVPFVGEGDPFHGELIGSGLAARRSLDLSRLTLDSLLTPNARFYVRTGPPERLPQAADWRIRIRDRAGTAVVLPVDRLRALARPMGAHLLECSGNGWYGRFGLMSAARWTGVPVLEALALMGLASGDHRVLVSGFDEHNPVPGSLAGASWIFSVRDLAATGAFLALGMNGVPLPREHGTPVRLVVPGWYGCACIKWVDEIALVPDDAPATGQMREFARRTHQLGVPELARDYLPARIDPAALPVRVEHRNVGTGQAYRVVGIVWGGVRPVHGLTIRFAPDAGSVPVEDHRPANPQTWSLWSHAWRPARPGRYTIRLQIDDPGVRTRRLDRGFYDRTVVLKTL